MKVLLMELRIGLENVCSIKPLSQNIHFFIILFICLFIYLFIYTGTSGLLTQTFH